MEIIRRNPLFTATRTISTLQDLAARLGRAQEQAITGSRVNRPSDAVGRWASLHGLSADRADQSVWLEGADRAQDLMDVAESTLGSASSTMQRAWERAIQLANGTYSTEERTAAAAEIRGLRDELVGLANTRVGDRFLFSGDSYDAAAFDATGAYLGTTATSEIRVGRDQGVAVGLDGGQVFQGGVDAFQALTDLEAALAADDAVAVGASITNLEASHGQLVDWRSRIGFRQNQIADARVVSENLSSLLDERLSAATEIDPAAAYTELGALQTSYEAALRITAAGAGTNLFQLLRG